MKQTPHIWLQRLSVAIQRGNAASGFETIKLDNQDEVFYVFNKNECINSISAKVEAGSGLGH